MSVIGRASLALPRGTSSTAPPHSARCSTRSQRVSCAADASTVLAAPTTSSDTAASAPASQHTAAAGGGWPHHTPPHVAQRHVQQPACPPPSPQQQPTQQQQQQVSPPLPTAQAAVTTTTTREQQRQTRAARKQLRTHKHAGTGQQQPLQQQQHQQPQQHAGPLVAGGRPAPVKYRPCTKRDGLQLAGSISQQLRQGKQVLIPAGAGVQLVRNTAMLASARSLLLSRDGATGLVLQPSFSTAAGATAQQQRHEKQPRASQPQTQAAAPASSTTGDRASTSSSGAGKGVMLLVSAVSEAQLRRFDQQPLIVARSTRTGALAAAMFARLCKRGLTSVRAAGPEATRLAMLAAAEARSKVLGCGLDLAVVPATEYVDAESLVGPDGLTQQAAGLGEGQEGGVGPGEELPTQFVCVTVLHLVRCEPQQPGKLLPWPVPAEMLPAVRHSQQQQQQTAVPQHAGQQQQEQCVAVLAGASEQQAQTAAGSGSSSVSQPRRPQQQQMLGQQQQAAPPAAAAALVAARSGLADAAVAAGWLAADGSSVQPGKALSPAAAGRLLVSLESLETAELLLGADDLLKLRAASDAAAGETVSSSPATSMAVRQPGGLLLQQRKRAKKGARQLVAAAQAAGSSGSTGQ